MSIIQIGQGDSSFLLECVECYSQQPQEGRSTVPTGLESRMYDLSEQVFEKLGLITNSIADNVRKGLGNLDSSPKEFELELSFAVTTTGKILVLSGETETGIKLNIKWGR